MSTYTDKRIQTFLTGFALFVMALTFPFAVHAAGDLDVVFESTPLFSELDVKPGDDVTRTVTVSNLGAVSHTVITTADNVTNTDGFGDVLNLDILFDGVSVFSGTFTDFFGAGEVVLGTLPGGDSVVVSYVVSIESAIGNTYQLATMAFDLLIGFEDSALIPDTPPPAPFAAAGGGGGNGPVELTNFFISNVRVVAQNATLGTATIAWDTNQLSSSQIVFGTQTGAPYNLNGNAPFFGYPQGLIEVFDNTVAHQMTLTGLIAGETYVFRTASRPGGSALPTTSFERSFTLGVGAPDPTPPPITSTEILQGGEAVDGAGGVGGGGFFVAPGGGANGGVDGEGAGAGGTTTGEGGENVNGPAAAAAFLGIPAEFFEFLGSVSCWLWIVLIVMVNMLIWLGIDMFVDEWGVRFVRTAGRATTFIVGLGGSAVVAWLIGEVCLVIPLSLGALIAVIFLLISLFSSGSST